MSEKSEFELPQAREAFFAVIALLQRRSGQQQQNWESLKYMQRYWTHSGCGGLGIGFGPDCAAH